MKLLTEEYLSGKETALFKKVGAAADRLKVPCRLVGGFVRDTLMGRPTKDADIVCEGDGILLAHEVAKSLGPAVRVAFFKAFGTAQLVAPGGLELEFVGARKESYRGESRKPDVETGTFEEDEARRDFTINALSVPLNGSAAGELHDPFDGVSDIKNKILRTPLDPVITLSEDPLRSLRAARFAAQLGFAIAAETLSAMQETAGRLAIVSQERITDELQKIIKTAKPSVGFEVLFHTGLLEQFFPQLVTLAGVEMIEGKGHKDNFFHTLQVLDNVAQRSDKLWLRWAAVLHDIAKPATKRFEAGRGWTFHGHDAVGARMVPRLFKALKLPLGEPMKYVAKLVALHLRPISLSKEDITDSAMRRLLVDAGEDLEDLMLLCESDITSKNEKKVRQFLKNFELVKERLVAVEASDQMRAWQPPVSGNDIMELFGLPAGREVGNLKAAVREAILEGDIPNTREAALAFLKNKRVEELKD